MTVPTTRPLGLGFGIVSQACACYDTDNANWPGIGVFLSHARNALNASWVHNWHHAQLACLKTLEEWTASPPLVDWFYSSIDNLNSAQADGRWDVLTNEAKESGRFYILWNESNLNGVSPVDVATRLKEWKTSTRKLVNGVWVYTKWAAPGVYIDGVTKDGNHPYGLLGTGGVGEYLVEMMNNLNVAQMPDTWNIHIYADSVSEFEAIWAAWKDWMYNHHAKYTARRITIVGELNIPGAGAGTQQELMQSVANLIVNDPHFAGAAHYALGSSYTNAGDDTEELWQFNTVAGACPGCVGGSGKFSPTTNLTETGGYFCDVASALGQT